MDQLNGKTVCFTGHRIIPAGEKDAVTAKLDVIIERCVEKGYGRFVAGGALGFDKLAADRVIAFRKAGRPVTLCLVLPCRDQTKLWKSLPDINEYRKMKEEADEIIYVQEFYDSKCMMKRNRMMVDMSSLCIAYFDGRSGGTSNTVKYANEVGVSVVNLSSKVSE
ncbi:MAG: DUF1273 family protein [Clostridia bacterium]|nr:DUF1273 family protein [Clostridia bacterium]